MRARFTLIRMRPIPGGAVLESAAFYDKSFVPFFTGQRSWAAIGAAADTRSQFRIRTATRVRVRWASAARHKLTAEKEECIDQTVEHGVAVHVARFKAWRSVSRIELIVQSEYRIEEAVEDAIPVAVTAQEQITELT